MKRGKVFYQGSLRSIFNSKLAITQALRLITFNFFNDIIMLSENWPFQPSKTPFFYGWIILLFSTLGILFSIPGQTIGLAVFTDSFIDA
jgi:hypothetical protein